MSWNEDLLLQKCNFLYWPLETHGHQDKMKRRQSLGFDKPIEKEFADVDILPTKHPLARVSLYYPWEIFWSSNLGTDPAKAKATSY